MNKLIIVLMASLSLTGCKTIEQAINKSTRTQERQQTTTVYRTDTVPAKTNEAVLQEECLKFVKAQTAFACDVKANAAISNDMAAALNAFRLPIKVASPSISDARIVQKKLLDYNVNSSITTTDKVGSGFVRIVVGK